MIDFDKLKQELSDYIVEGAEERYQFTWPDKKKAILTANSKINKTLRPCREESVNFDTTENLYIEGDNLEVLKLLQETYLGKVKMIYIDPPYNTGSDFVYRDNFTIDKDEYMENSGQSDEDGNRMVQNLESNGRYHTDWLNMMYPRLKLARDLLADDGVIFISIDDNEQENLKKICDEIFCEDNFVNCIAVKMSEPTGVKMAHVEKKLPKLKEYILAYKKKDICLKNIQIPKDKWDSEYKTFLDGLSKEEIEYILAIKNNESRTNDEIEKVNNLLKKAVSRPLYEIYNKYNISSESDQIQYNYDNAWRIFRTASMSDNAKKQADDYRKEHNNPALYSIVTPKKKMYIIKGDYSYSVNNPRIKILFASEYLTVNPCDFWQDIKTTGLDNEGFVDFKNGKKPLKLIKRLLDLINDKNAVIMDFFSGSATTAQAVMEINEYDKGKRQYILVQIPENLDISLSKTNDNDTKKSLLESIKFLDSINKPHTICEIGKERIRRAGAKIKSEHPEAKDLDIGFRVLKCDSSNMKDVYYTPAETVNMNMFDLVDNVKEDRTAEDLLFQCMLEFDAPLSSSIETMIIGDKTVYNVAGGHLMACFDTDVTEEVITEVAKLEPSYFVMRDSSLANDSVAANFEQIFKTYSPSTERRVL